MALLTARTTPAYITSFNRKNEGVSQAEVLGHGLGLTSLSVSLCRCRSSHTNKTSDRQVRGSSLPSINDYDFTTRRMDIDAPRPRCPFCGLPMRFVFSELSTLQTFDCKSCQVALNIPSQAGVSGIAVPVLARG